MQSKLHFERGIEMIVENSLIFCIIAYAWSTTSRVGKWVGGPGCHSVEGIDLQPGTSEQTVFEDQSASPFFAEPGRFEWCRCPAAGMCNEYSLHR